MREGACFGSCCHGYKIRVRDCEGSKSAHIRTLFIDHAVSSCPHLAARQRNSPTLATRRHHPLQRFAARTTSLALKRSLESQGARDPFRSFSGDEFHLIVVHKLADIVDAGCHYLLHVRDRLCLRGHADLRDWSPATPFTQAVAGALVVAPGAVWYDDALESPVKLGTGDTLETVLYTQNTDQRVVAVVERGHVNHVQETCAVFLGIDDAESTRPNRDALAATLLELLEAVTHSVDDVPAALTALQESAVATDDFLNRVPSLLAERRVGEGERAVRQVLQAAKRS